MILALVGVTLIPLAISYFQIELGRDATIEQARTTHLVVARSMADRASDHLALLGRFGETIAHHPRLADPVSPAAREVLQNSLLEGPDMMAAGLYLITEGDPRLIQMARKPGHAEAVEAALTLEDPRLLTFTRAPEETWIRLRVVLEDERLALFLVSRPPLFRMDSLPTEIGPDFDLVLARPSGEILMGNVENLEDFPAEMLEAVRLDQGLSGAAEYASPDGPRVIGSYAPVVGAPLYALSKQPARYAERSADAMARGAWFAVATTALLLTIFSLAAHRTIVRPIRELAAAQRKLVGGTASTTGEIADLRETFAELEQRIHDREALDQISLGRYQVVDVLGSGAMGTVFRGWDPRLERYVALKTLKLDTEKSTTDLRKQADSLRQEAVTLARIQQHPNIVTIFDVLGEEETAIIAMEHIDGMSLDNYLWEHVRLTVDQVVPLGVAMLAALDTAHQEDIVHHDVKPGNILLGRDGSIKVTDFGISEIISRSSQLQDSVYGTPGYLAPEALRGKGYDERSDLFALGVVLYECLVGKPPFRGANQRQVLLRTLRGNATPVSSVRPEVPRALDRLVQGLLAPDPDDRPQVAEILVVFEELSREREMRWRPNFEGIFSAPESARTHGGFQSTVALP